MTLADELEEAEARVAELKRRAATATCAEIGHDWQCLGGRNCGCHDWSNCSVPVHECRRCGGCDYGDNTETAEIVRHCKEHYPEWHDPAIQLENFPS